MKAPIVPLYASPNTLSHPLHNLFQNFCRLDQISSQKLAEPKSVNS